jgi:L-threonylcarbamoyladenylate synthase
VSVSIVRVDAVVPDPEVLRRAGEILREGGLVAFPTETVYGLGANALDAAAVFRIFQAKGRPSFNPLIVHAADTGRVRDLVSAWPATASALADAFWPGPLTLVLQKQPFIPDVVTAGLGTVAVRVPAHPVAQALLRAAGIPLAAPSANRFTELSPTTADHVLLGLGDRIDMILDGGPTNVGIESAVVDLSGAEPVLLRPGSISRTEIERVVGPLKAPERSIGQDAPRPSPGMLARHYAPRARLVLFAGARIPRAAVHVPESREGIGALLLRASAAGADLAIRMPEQPLEYARRLYAALHEIDRSGCSTVFVELPPDTPAWSGVHDRLQRAAAD